MKTSRSKPPLPPNRGFALIVTLSLMILLTIIAMGLLTLSSISLRGSSNAQQKQEAQSNARMALMLALGELQVTSGPDTRVTARADILNASNPPLLGVWKSWEGTDHDPSGLPTAPNYGDKTRNASQGGRFLSWLVSGNPSALTQSNSVPPVTAGSNRIPLIGPNSVGNSSPSLQVHLDPVFINNRRGSYVWWIGGENQKARLPKPYTGTTNADWASQMKSHSVADPKPFSMESLFASTGLAERAVSIKQTDLIDQGASTSADRASRRNFFDLSTESFGLLTNTATGGWRKDLSLFTERYDSLPTSGLPLFRINPTTDDSRSRSRSGDVRAAGSLLYPWAAYRGTASAAPPLQRGAVASWENLKDYAMQYRAFKDISNFSVTSTPISNTSSAYNHMHKVRMMPVVARVQWVFSYYGRVASNGREFTPGILVNPVFTLWNPYNVTLRSIGALSFTVGDKSSPCPLPVAFKYEVTTGNPDHRVSDFKSLTQGSTNYKNLPPMANTTFIKTMRYVIPAVADLPPGATRIYCSKDQNLAAYPRELTPGYRPGNGNLFICTRPSAPSDWIYTTNGAAKMKLEVRFDNASSQKGRDSVGVRLIVRQEANLNVNDDNNSSAGTDANEVEYRMIVPPSMANSYGDMQVAESKPLSQISNTASPFMSLICGLRLANNLYDRDQEQTPGKGLLQSNPLAIHTANGEMDTAEIGRHFNGTSHRVNFPMDFSFVRHTENDDIAPNVDANNNGFILTGLTNSSRGGLSRAIVAEVPTKPLASLAELQNWDMRAGNPVPPFAFNVIGNSDASPLLPQAAVTPPNAGNPSNNLQHDDSYCANHLLFDDWFFSSIAAGTPERFGTTSSFTNAYVNLMSTETPLTNRSYKAHPEDASRAKQSPSDAQAYVTRTDSWRNIASRLEVEGMFNVNSTSVTAWRTLLGHARNQKIPFYSASGSVSLSNDTNHAISRFSVAGNSSAGSSSTTSGNTANSQFTGYRTLDDALIEQLATQMVNQVRKRGPFLSLSEFVNRQLSSDNELSLAGAIQTALNQIDQSSALTGPIRNGFESAYKNSSGNVVGAEYAFPAAAEGSSVYGLPGWTRQADVLRPLAPILSARDDTFVIRAYGDSRTSGNVIKASAVCEAVVRRSRDYCDPTDAADLANPPSSNVNQRFGRRFQIVSFRWISPQEI